MGYSVGSASFGIKAMIIAQLLQVFFPVTFAVDRDCYYNQQMEPSVKYYVYNNEYPENYPAGRNCIWIATAPENYTFQFNCQIEMSQTEDKLLISFTGDPNFVDADNYFDFGNINLATHSNKISIGLVSASNTTGGRFLCTVVANPVENNCNCGWKNTERIVGGTETGIHEFPMMAGLIDILTRDEFCGATIIGRKYAVTAAHCFMNQNEGRIGLFVGAHHFPTTNNAFKLMRLDQIIVHPLYDRPDAKVNDIAIVQTTEFIEFNIDVGAACLPFRNLRMSFERETVDVLGWGSPEFSVAKSDVLLKTDMYVLSIQDCYSHVGGSMNEICTFKAGHDPCQGDSGGPLLWLDPNTKHIQLVGVVSSEFHCAATKPTVNTRVTAYLNWIQSVTPDAEYCVY